MFFTTGDHLHIPSLLSGGRGLSSIAGNQFNFYNREFPRKNDLHSMKMDLKVVICSKYKNL